MMPQNYIRQEIIKLEKTLFSTKNDSKLRHLIEQELIKRKNIERNLRDPDHLWKKHVSSIKKCMAFDNKECKGGIIQAHGISEKDLKNIAEQGHVLALDESSHYAPTGAILKHTGIDKAGNFTGFCEHHDDILFRSYEKNLFIGSYEQIYACAFKALAKQLFELKHQFNDYQVTLDRESERNFGKDYISSKKHFDDTAIQKEIFNHEFLYNEFRNLEKSGLLYVVLETSKLPIAASGVLFPPYQLGEKIESEHGIIYYILTKQNASYIILATISDPSNIGKFILNYYKNINLSTLNILLSSFVQYSNNFFISPAWFNSLDNDFKENLKNWICRRIVRENTKRELEIMIFKDLAEHVGINSLRVYDTNL